MYRRIGSFRGGEVIFVFNGDPIRALLHLHKHLKLVTVGCTISDYMDLELGSGSLRECHKLKIFFFSCLEMCSQLLKVV